MRLGIELITIFGAGTFGDDVSFTALCYGDVAEKFTAWLRANWEQLYRAHGGPVGKVPYGCPTHLKAWDALRLLEECGVRTYQKCVIYEGPGPIEKADLDGPYHSPTAKDPEPGKSNETKTDEQL